VDRQRGLPVLGQPVIREFEMVERLGRGSGGAFELELDRCVPGRDEAGRGYSRDGDQSNRQKERGPLAPAAATGTFT
jgi:hypothetical protein